MQKEITTKVDLLNENGQLKSPGWARKLFWDYNKEVLPEENFKRLIEWDYHLLTNDKFGLSVSIALVGNASRITVDFMNFLEGYHTRKTSYTDNAISMPKDDIGDVVIKTEDAVGEFVFCESEKRLRIYMNDFFEGDDIDFTAVLSNLNSEKMVIATPFHEGGEYFFYNMKHNCMRVSGKITIGSKQYDFFPNNSFAVRDWGRGIWPKHNRWFWGSGSGIIDGKDFGFNLGYGFGNLDAATENVIFCGGKVHKFDQIVFNIPSDSYVKPWTIVSNDDRFVMDFIPVLDRSTIVDNELFGTEQHQVFGRFTGKAVLDNGDVVEIKDFFGFAEDVVNRW